MKTISTKTSKLQSNSTVVAKAMPPTRRDDIGWEVAAEVTTTVQKEGCHLY